MNPLNKAIIAAAVGGILLALATHFAVNWERWQLERRGWSINSARDCHEREVCVGAFSFSVALLVFYAVFHRKSHQKHDAASTWKLYSLLVAASAVVLSKWLHTGMLEATGLYRLLHNLQYPFHDRLIGLTVATWLCALPVLWIVVVFINGLDRCSDKAIAHIGGSLTLVYLTGVITCTFDLIRVICLAQIMR